MTRSSRDAALLTLALVLGVLGGCTLFLDTSNLSSGQDAARPDAALDAPDAPDASADAPGSDAPPGDTGAPPACSGAFADSFDQGALGATWDGLQQANGTLALDTIFVKSAPNALLVTALPDGGTIQAFLYKKLPTAKAVCCEFSMKSDADDIQLFKLKGNGGNYNVIFGNGSGNVYLNEGYYAGPVDPGIDRQISTLARSVTTWPRIHIEVAFPSGPGKGTLTVFTDGVLALKDTLGSDDYDLNVDRVEVGMIYAESVGTTRTARYDDLTCGAK